MAQFVIRLINHFASEVITKRLANSRSFQQFAMRTHLKVEETKKMIDDPKEAERILRETLKQSAGLGTKPKEGGESAVARFERFKAALKEEVSKDYKTGANSSSRSDKRPSDMASRAAARRGRK